MIDERYLKQVELLIRILPEVAAIPAFALHGGTAINLFHFNMPRLSVDIDLTLVPHGDRSDDLNKIAEELRQLSKRLLHIIPDLTITAPKMAGNDYKLFCRNRNGLVKIEVNTINRGIMASVVNRSLSEKAQNTFNIYVELNTVPEAQLFGGKIIAALDRQHPRDIFDTKNLLDAGQLNEEIMDGVIFCMFSSKRPLHELLDLNFIDQTKVLANQFLGMTYETFTYEMFVLERERLVKAILSNLNDKHKNLIMSFGRNEPQWSLGDWGDFPGIKWKLENQKKMQKINRSKYLTSLNLLEFSLFK